MFRFLVTLFLLLGAFLAPAANAQDNQQTPNNIQYGETIQWTISPEASLEYVFDATSGDAVSILASADDPQALQLSFALFDPSGTQIATGQDYSDIGTAVLDMRVEQDGQHRIVLQAAQGEGNFELTLQGYTANEYQTVFREDFAENDVAWETAAELPLPGGAIRISEPGNGTYNIEGIWLTPIWSWIIAPGANNWAVAPIFAPPYEVEVEFINVQSSTGNYLIGLALYVQENYAGYHQITVQKHDNVVNALNYQGPGRRSDWMEFEPVTLDESPHRLRIVVKSDKEYVIWLDNHFIYRLVQENGVEWENGTIGLVLGASHDDTEATISAAFDNLIVRVPTVPQIIGPSCTVKAVVVANVRTAPDLNATVVRQLAPGELDTANGYATGSDGYLWWRLQDNNWVHSAVVLGESVCGNLDEVVL